MALSISSNYNGQSSKGLISAAIYSAPTIAGEGVVVMPNIKMKTNIRKADFGTNLIQADSCDFNAQGTLTLTEAVLDPTNLATMFQGCKTDYESYWIADQMKPGAMNSDAPQEFISYVLDLMGRKIAEGLEYNIWSGNLPASMSATTSTGYTAFDGFIKLINAGSPNISNGYAINATTVVSAMTAAYLIAPAKIRKPNMTFYVSPNTAAYYQLSQANKSLERGTDGERPLNFMGYKIIVTHGIPDNNIFVADPENLFVGTDILSDANSIQTIDMTPIDGSMNFRYVARYKFGAQIGYTNEIGWFKSTT